MHPIEHFCCQNSRLPRCRRPGPRKSLLPRLQRQGPTHPHGLLPHLQGPFSERKGTVLEQARLPDEKALAVLNHLREGCGTRATGRLVEVDKNTVTRYLAKAGAHAEPLHDELVAFSPRDP